MSAGTRSLSHRRRLQMEQIKKRKKKKKRPSGEDTVPVETHLERISEVTAKVTDLNATFL